MIKGMPSKLKELRTLQGLSQKEAAAKLGLSPSVISAYETGGTHAGCGGAAGALVSVPLQHGLPSGQKGYLTVRLHRGGRLARKTGAGNPAAGRRNPGKVRRRSG